MSDENEDLQDIPTLTDVVKSGNPSLIFNLSPPPSSEEFEEEAVIESAETETETETETEEFTGFHHLEQTMVIDEPPVAPEEDIEALRQSSSTNATDGIDLSELGLPEGFFNQIPATTEQEDIDVASSHTSEEAKERAPVELPQGDLNPESLLMGLEAPVSDILQRHMEMAREEILDLIRDEIARQVKNNDLSGD